MYEVVNIYTLYDMWKRVYLYHTYTHNTHTHTNTLYVLTTIFSVLINVMSIYYKPYHNNLKEYGSSVLDVMLFLTL